jgi:biotin-(acetyl-CoA carboxylase) ligase
VRQLIAEINEQLRPSATADFVPVIVSTSSELKRRIALGELTHPTILVAAHQTGGRGTRGRHWVMPIPPKNARWPLDIALTLAWQPASPPDPRLSLALAAIVAQSVERALRLHAGGKCPDAPWGIQVKWPNDLVCADAAAQPPSYRKVGGILLENTHGWLLAGIGINVNSQRFQFPPELQAELTTLHDELRLRAGDYFPPEPVLYSQLLAALCSQLVQQLVVAPELETWLEQWQARDITGGARYLLARDGRSFPVVAERIDPASGALLCRDAAGVQHAVIAVADLTPLHSRLTPEN